MAGRWREREYRRLEEEIQGRDYGDLLRRLKQDSRWLRGFDTWNDVVAFMRAGSSNDPRKDDVLRPILAAHWRDKDQRWRTILLVLFWPGLASIHRRKRSWDNDLGELWQAITWTFLEVVCRLDPILRPRRLVQKLYNDTVHHLHDEYRRRWNRASHETGMEDERLVVLAGAAEGLNLDDFALREAQEAELGRLRGYVARGLLSEPDLYLLVGTRVYGRPLRDCAAEIGLSYQAAKKRRQRAEANLGPRGSR